MKTLKNNNKLNTNFYNTKTENLNAKQKEDMNNNECSCCKDNTKNSNKKNLPKTTIAVIFGGKSVESDVSVITGVQALNAIDKTKYNVLPLYISKYNDWYTSPEFFNIKTFSKDNFLLNKTIKKVVLTNGGMLIDITKKKPIIYQKIQFAILATHGNMGENGALQGFLDICGVSYSSPNVFSSAVCTNKVATKILLKSAGINVTNYALITQEEYKNLQDKKLDELLKNLKLPLIVKPCNLGSSVGITYCKNYNNLKDAISFALLFDSAVLIEEAVENLKEVNLSILGNSTNLQTSQIEEVETKDNFLTFENKYLGSNSGKGMESSNRKIPADISEDIKSKIIEYGLTAYKVLGCKGIVRIDFLINTKTSSVYLNEVNTIPGSLSNYLWKENYSFFELLNKVIELSLQEKEIENSKVTNFSSTILTNFEKYGKLGAKK